MNDGGGAAQHGGDDIVHGILNIMRDAVGAPYPGADQFPVMREPAFLERGGLRHEAGTLNK